MRRDWLEAYDFATKRGAQFLGEYARSASPFANVGERTVSVQVTSVVRASDESFQVKWTETAFERGSQSGVSRWTAILTTVTRPPARSEEHTSELQSLMRISYAVFCLKKKKNETDKQQDITYAEQKIENGGAYR